MNADNESLTMKAGLEERVLNYHRRILERMNVSKRARPSRTGEDVAHEAVEKTAKAFGISAEQVKQVLLNEETDNGDESARIAAALERTERERSDDGVATCDLCGLDSPDVSWRLDERTYAGTAGAEIVHPRACTFCWRDELRAE